MSLLLLAKTNTEPVTDEEARIVKTHLFPALSKAGVSKTMTFKKRGDFGIYFSYAKTGLHSFVHS